MSPTVPIALFGWWAVVAVACVTMRPRRAAILLLLLGWLFLPVAEYRVQGLPNYGKTQAITLAVVICALLGGRDRLRGLRWTWVDTAALCFSIAPALSALAVDLGSYNAAARTLGRFLEWGGYYFAGRMLIGSAPALRDLCWALIAAGLCYGVLCLWEVRMSPQIHREVYGFFQHMFRQMKRDGGFRPIVFLYHGLVVAILMGTTAVTAAVAWRTRTFEKVLGLPIHVAVGALFVVTVLCKSVGPIALTCFALTLVFALPSRTALLVWRGALLAAVTYIVSRASGLFSGEFVSNLLDGVVSDERLKSLNYRLDAENLIGSRARQHPWFGWSNEDLQLVQGDYGEKDQRVATDSRWLIEFTVGGWFALSSLIACYSLAILGGIRRIAAMTRATPWFGPAVTLTLIVTIDWLDKTVNGVQSPITLVGLGALATFAQRGVPLEDAQEFQGALSPQSAAGEDDPPAAPPPGHIAPRAARANPVAGSRGGAVIRPRRVPHGIADAVDAEE